MATLEKITLEFDYDIKDVSALVKKYGEDVQVGRDALTYLILERVAESVRSVSVLDGAIVATLQRARSGEDWTDPD